MQGQGKRMEHTWNITRASRIPGSVSFRSGEKKMPAIPILPPRSTYTFILLIYLEVDISQTLWDAYT